MGGKRVPTGASPNAKVDAFVVKGEEECEFELADEEEEEEEDMGSGKQRFTVKAA
jgi:hypothetical protein